MGVLVTVQDEATSASQPLVTGADGFARFVSGKPSVCTVDVSRDGFKKITCAHVDVNVAESVTLRLSMEAW